MRDPSLRQIGIDSATFRGSPGRVNLASPRSPIVSLGPSGLAVVEAIVSSGRT